MTSGERFPWITDEGQPMESVILMADQIDLADLIEVLTAGLQTPKIKFQAGRTARVVKQVSLFKAILNARPRQTPP